MKRLACIFAVLLSLPASAQTVNCADRNTLVAKLTMLGEAQSGIGLSARGQVFEIWTSERTGTWTIVLSQSSGVSCIMSYGHNWAGATAQVAGLPA